MKSFLRLVLEQCEITQAEAARELGWSYQRIGFLCSNKVAGFNFNELLHLKESLGISSSKMWSLIEENLRDKK